jgi:hypothetical protein
MHLLPRDLFNAGRAGVSRGRDATTTATEPPAAAAAAAAAAPSRGRGAIIVVQ